MKIYHSKSLFDGAKAENKIGLAKQGWALGPAQGQACDQTSVCCEGPTSTKINFLLKNIVLAHFWSFLDLLGLKNGSGSKFYAGNCYREVWKPRIKLFRKNSGAKAENTSG